MRFCLLAFGMVQCLLTAGTIFGWVSLVPILIQDGIYDEYCTRGDCSQQLIRFHFAYTIGSSCNMGANLLLGIVFDRFGPRNCKLLSLLLIGIGSTMVGLASSRYIQSEFIIYTYGVDWLLPGVSLLGFGGTGIQLGTVHLSNLFPKHTSTVTCLIVGVFQLSFVVFGAFQTLYTEYHISRRILFLSYDVVLGIMFVITWFLSPSTPYDDSIEMADSMVRMPTHFKDKDENLLDSTPIKKYHSLDATDAHDIACLVQQKVPLKYRSFKTQLSSTPFFLIALYFVTATFWCNYLVGSLHYQLLQRGFSIRDINAYMSAFNFLLPASVVVIPFIGCILKAYGFVIVLYGAAFMSILYTVLLQCTSYWNLVAAFSIYSIYRTVSFAVTFAYLSDQFGFKHFGAISGIIFTVAALIGLLQPLVLDLQGDTSLFILQLLSFTATFSLPYYESFASRAIA